MGEFFRGWRRKAGVVTLAFVLLFALGWVRSTLLADFIGILSKDTTYYVVSHGGLLNVETLMPMSSEIASRRPEDECKDTRLKSVFTVTKPRFANPQQLIWGSHRLSWFNEKYGIRVGLIDVVWQDYEVQRIWNFGCLQFVAGNDGGHRVTKIIIPYWSIVLPLTVLSAWLLLSKPRKSKQKPVEQTAMIGA